VLVRLLVYVMKKWKDILKMNLKKLCWLWKLFWGNRYRIYDKDKNEIKNILIYHKKIYLLD